MAVLLFCLFSSMLLHNLNANMIPTKEEQANLLTNVEEVFEQVKVLVSIETNSTDISVVSDIKRMVQRAKDKLALQEELALTKMTREINSVCMIDFKQRLQSVIGEGVKLLDECVKEGSSDVYENSRRLTNATDGALQRGQDLLDTLHNCSQKPGLQVITCYKNVIANDVIPVKNIILGAIQEHMVAHVTTIGIRESGNKCVDSILELYARKIQSVLHGAKVCN